MHELAVGEVDRGVSLVECNLEYIVVVVEGNLHDAAAALLRSLQNHLFKFVSLHGVSDNKNRSPAASIIFHERKDTKKSYICNVDNKTFNKYFSVFVLVGMTVVTIAATALKFGPADGRARLLLIIAAFGSLMGVAATVASANGKIITFLFGLLDVSIYGAMCLMNWKNGSSGLGNAVLHFLYFVPMQFVGFAQWRKRGNNDEGSVKARRLSPKQRVLACLVFLAGSAVAYFIIAQFDKSAADTFIKTAVVLDVLPLMCNIIGQLLMSTAYMEQWIFWIGVNVFSITMWAVTLHNDAGSTYALIYIIKYSFYLINSVNGLRNWILLSKPDSPDPR